MPRDGADIYAFPPGTPGIPDTTIASTKYNSYIADIALDLNYPRPIVAGGTGANNAATARDQTHLQAERSMQVVTNFDSAVWEPGSFYAASTATNPPVAGHAFAGSVYGPDANNMVIEARDLDDAQVPGVLYVREKKAGVWGVWKQDAFDAFNGKVDRAGDTMTGDLTISKSIPRLILNTTDTLPAVIGSSRSGKSRWVLLPAFGADTGSANGGSDFALQRYADDGVTGIDFPLIITRTDGRAVLSVDPIAPLGIATKQYVDAAAALKVAKAGDTMTGALFVNNATASGSTTTGALKVTGGVGIGGATYLGGQLNLTANAKMTLTSAANTAGWDFGFLNNDTTGYIFNRQPGSLFIVGVNNTAQFILGATSLQLNTTAPSTGPGNGALIVTGGVGIGGRINNSDGLNTYSATATNGSIFASTVSDLTNYGMAALVGSVNQGSYPLTDTAGGLTGQTFNANVKASIAGMGSFNHTAGATKMIVGVYGWVPGGGHGSTAIPGMFDRPDGNGGNAGHPYSVMFCGSYNQAVGPWPISLQDWTTGSNTFRVLGDGACNNLTGVYAIFSAREIKRDIDDAPSFLDRVLGTKVRQYNLKDDTPDVPPRWGVVIDEQEDTWPSLIIDPKGDQPSFNTYGLIIPHLSAFQEYVKTTNARLARLEGKPA